MSNTQKNFKSSFLAAILIVFARHNSLSYAVVEKPNLTPYIILGGAGLAASVLGTILRPGSNFQNLLEEKAIDAWIAKNDLNQFGEPKNTIYADPMQGPLNGQYRFDYIRDKFVDEDVKPWRSGFARLLNRVNGLDHRAASVACGGMSLMLFAFIVSTILNARYTDASWQETIAGWKNEAELEKKQLVSDIVVGVVAGISNASAANNA